MPAPKIVIVDDDDTVRSVIVAIVKEAAPSAWVLEFFSSLHALREIEKGGTSLLITNFAMADMNGAELVQSIREAKHAVPIIMVSGSIEARLLGEQAGIDRFVPKHTLLPGLKEAIASLL